LKLLEHDVTSWREALQKKAPTHALSADDFAALWVQVLLERPRLLQVFAILYTLIEKNATLEALTDFKKSIYAEQEFAIGMMMTYYPTLSAEDANEFLQASLSLAIGMHPLLDMTEKQINAMKTNGMIYSADSYQQIWIHSTESLLNGLLNK
jgi:hypothetical protein